MRLRVILIGLVAGAFAGGALAQSPGAIKLRGKFTTPALTATPSPDNSLAAPSDLRGPLGAPSTTARPATDDDGEPLQAPPPAQAAPAPGQSFAGGLPPVLTGGFAASALPSLPSLQSVGDPAPICRADCSKTRIYCAGTDDPGCDSQWAQCIAACSAPTTR